MTDLDALWGEMLLHACASDGPIRDADVRQAIEFYRPRIEAEARRLVVDRMLAMRRDYQTLPHAEFPVKWPDWREWKDVLPTVCGCEDCRLWRSGS